MRSVPLIFVLGLACTPWLHAQDAAKAVAKEVLNPKRVPPLSIEALCTRLTLDEVKAVLGAAYVRKPEKDALFGSCTYGDGSEKSAMPIRYFKLSNSKVDDAGFRRIVEGVGRGKVVERDGVLVSHLRRNKFGTDTVWFMDREGRALELAVNAGVSEDQAVSLVKLALN